MGREREGECLVMWVARKLEARKVRARERVKDEGGGKTPPDWILIQMLWGVHTRPCENINKVTGEGPLASGIISEYGIIFAQTQPDAGS